MVRHSSSYVAQAICVLVLVLAYSLAGNAQAIVSNVGVAPSSPVTYGTGQTFSVTVTSGGIAVTTGTVTFTDTTTNATLASNPLNASGQASTPAVLNAGPHNIKATYSGNGSFNTVAVTVNKAPLIVTANDAELPYGVVPGFGVRFSGFVNNDGPGALTGTPTFAINATLRNGLPNAGTWTITLTQGTLASANYSLTFVNGTMIVDKQILDVTCNDITMVQGNNPPPVVWRLTGFINGDSWSTDVVTGAPQIVTGVTAMSDPGTYTIQLSQGTLAAQNYLFVFINGVLTVTPSAQPAATLTITSGSPQTTTVNTAFANILQVVAKDQSGQVVPNVPVTFTAPSSGASVSVTQQNATTDTNGLASVTVTANTIAGSYTVTATAGAVSSDPFQLTNKPDAPATITATAGTPQTATVGSLFSSPLQAAVTDKFSNSVPGTTVTFVVNRTSDAGAIFPHGNTVVTDSSGNASISVRAGASGGSYTITASAGSATTAIFNLTNTPQMTFTVPALLSGTATQFGFAWTNPSSTAVSVTLTARDYDGQLLNGPNIQNPVQLSVAAHNQLAKPAAEIFGSGIAGQTGWVEVDTNTQGAGGGFFLLYDAALTTVDGGTFVDTPTSRLFFPHVDGTTTFHIVNTGSQTLQSTFLFVYDNTGAVRAKAPIPLFAYAGWSGTISDILPGLNIADGYVLVDTQGSLFSTSSPVLAGMASYHQTSGDNAIIMGQDDSKGIQTGYVLHLVSGGGYSSTIKLINIDPNQQQIQLTFNGSTVQRLLPPGGRLNETLDHLFNLSGSTLSTGYLNVQVAQSSAGVIGYVEISGPGHTLTAEPLVSETNLQLTFSQDAQGAGFFTGMALLNPDPSNSASVTVEVDSTTGTAIASKTISVAGGQRFVGLLTDLFPTLQTQLGGSIHITSSQPIYALEIFGSTSQTNNFFATIPPANF